MSASELKASGDFFYIKGESGKVWGAALRATKESSKPLIVSLGHRVSIDTALQLTKATCKFRIPEPIRQADLRSREHVRKVYDS